MAQRNDVRALPALFRLSIAFSPLADVLTGYAVGAHFSSTPLTWNARVLFACLASIAAFCFGAGLNDFVDRQRDQKDAPGRPLPSGRITPRVALGASSSMAVLALVFAFLAGYATFCAMALVLALILSYDFLTKTRALPGVINLGCIRGADLWVGVTLGDGSLLDGWSPSLDHYAPLLVLVLYACYGMALSWVALAERGGETVNPRIPAWTACGIALLPVVNLAGRTNLIPACFIWAVLALPVFRFFEQGRKDAEHLVGHLVAGFFLLGAILVLGLDHPLLCIFLWFLFFLSRFLSRRFPPA